jgi:uncharacterized protein (UPF0332 family)
VQAVSHAYFAALHAAGAALLALDDAQSSEVGIVTTFVQHVPEEGLDAESGRLLRKLFEDRMDVDYALANAAPADAERAVEDAERLVKSIAAWMADRAAGR